MIWNGCWAIDKNDTDKEIVEVEAGATEISQECWIHEEVDVPVPVYPNGFEYISISTKAKFKKLILPESVVKIHKRAMYRCETIREISVLTNVTFIGKEAFKGCSGLSTIVAPLIKVTEIEDSDTKMKLAFGYCLNEKLYSEVIADDYLKYLKSQKNRILQNAEKYNLPHVVKFLIEKGIVSVGKETNKENAKVAKIKNKLSKLDAVLLLEKTVLDEGADISAVLNEYKPFETMSRALGLACRCRTPDIIELLVENDATFEFDSKVASKYGFNCKQSSKVVQAKFQLLPIVKNIWNEYIFGSFEKHYVKENAKSEYSEIIGSDVDFSEIPKEMKMGPIEDRLRNIRFLREKKIIKQDDINSMLYYSILEKEYTIAEELEEMGAVIDVPWLVADADHSRTISELHQYLDAMNRFEKDDRIRALNMFSSLLEKNGRQMYVNENIWLWLEAGKEGEIARALLRNGAISSINKSKFLKNMFSDISSESLSVLIENGFITSTKLRDELITSSMKSKRTEIVALLMEYKNKTANLEKEEAKRIKELTASPNSAYELKKSWISKKKNDGTLVITAYKGDATDVVVPSKIGSAVVTEIGEFAFSPDAKRIKNEDIRKKITRIVIPDTVKIIGYGAFAYCEKLKEVILPDSIATIGKKAFLGCEYIPERVMEMPKPSFSECENLTELLKW